MYFLPVNECKDKEPKHLSKREKKCWKKLNWKKTRENIGIHRKSMQTSIVYAKEKLIKASSCRRRICVHSTHLHILTPFWKAIEWIWIMLFRAKLKVSRRWRFQKMPSGTEVNEFPERSRLFNDPVKLCSSSRWRSEIRLSNKRKRRE